MRTFFYIAASNFVFPVMLSLAQLIFIYAKPDYYVGIYMTTLFFLNGVVQVLCLLLATVWVASNHSQEHSSQMRDASANSSLDSHRKRAHVERTPIPRVDLELGYGGDSDIALQSLEKMKSPSLTAVHRQSLNFSVH